ncbi:hypothetical protein [Pseudenhygromyxa sp. WMMC2535]|uniref:hypothetical protein n=1 Tax=Pseudenhygromyxa sp. WMMC2535 TaxID=2712867 RepID=UPI0031F8A2C6
MQKFSLTDEERTLGDAFPTLSQRRNIVVIADEAHRSQYEFESRVDPETGKVSHGLARNVRDALPNASFIGFTRTPIEFDDKSTPAVFGDYVDTYTIRQGRRRRRHGPDLLRGPARPDQPLPSRRSPAWTTSSRS